MGDNEDLLGALSKLIYLILQSHLLDWVFNVFDSDHAFISQMKEDVLGLNGFLTSLLVSEDQIDPFMKVV